MIFHSLLLSLKSTCAYLPLALLADAMSVVAHQDIFVHDIGANRALQVALEGDGGIDQGGGLTVLGRGTLIRTWEGF